MWLPDTACGQAGPAHGPGRATADSGGLLKRATCMAACVTQPGRSAWLFVQGCWAAGAARCARLRVGSQRGRGLRQRQHLVHLELIWGYARLHRRAQPHCARALPAASRRAARAGTGVRGPTAAQDVPSAPAARRHSSAPSALVVPHALPWRSATWRSSKGATDRQASHQARKGRMQQRSDAARLL